MPNSDLNKMWPEKRVLTGQEEDSIFSFHSGWNACREEFLKVINNKSMNCKHGMPQGQGCLQCQKESRNGM